MFRTGLLSIIRSLDTVFTATGICHASYVDLEDLKQVGKMTFGRYKEHKHKQLEESSTE